MDEFGARGDRHLPCDEMCSFWVTATALELDPRGQLQLPRDPGRDRRAEQRRTHGANVTSLIGAIEQVERVEQESHRSILLPARYEFHVV